MTVTVQDTAPDTPISLEQLIKPFDAMHLAQLCAFAFAVPQLYFCREYLNLDEQEARQQGMQRLQKGLNEQSFSLARLAELVAEREFFDDQEARLRLAPEPDFEDI